VPKETQANKAILGLKVLLGHKDPPVSLVCKEQLVPQDLWVLVV